MLTIHKIKKRLFKTKLQFCQFLLATFFFLFLKKKKVCMIQWVNIMLHMNNTNETKNKMFVWHSILKSLTTEMYNRLVLLLCNAKWLSNTVVPQFRIHFAKLITTTIYKHQHFLKVLDNLHILDRYQSQIH